MAMKEKQETGSLAVDIGINPEARDAVCGTLCSVLADQHVLYIKKRSFHRILVGARSHILHVFSMSANSYTRNSAIVAAGLVLAVAAASLFADEKPEPQVDVATLKPTELDGFTSQPKAVQALIKDALELTEQSLSYQYGSHDPEKGGMDCSGTIYHLLRKHKFNDVPRQANLIYKWVWQKGRFNAVVSEGPTTFELQRLKPGDLLFWAGTYKVDRDPPVTHVMLYLGKKKTDGKPVMFGASSGRRYEGISRHGVSVFDFGLPKKGGDSTSGMRPRFIGYASIPGLEGDRRSSPRDRGSGS